MKVTLLERSPGRFRLRIETRDEFGRRQFAYESLAGTREQAEIRKTQIEKGGSLKAKATDPTLRGFVAQWIKDREVFGEIRPTTAEWYVRLWEPALKLIGHKRLADLDTKTIDDAYRSLAQSFGARRTADIAIQMRKALGEAVKQSLTTADPTQGARVPKAERRTKERTLTAAQMTDLAEQSQGWGETGELMRFALATGLRRAEICGLQWQDVDLDHGIVRVQRIITCVGRQMFVTPPKTRKSRRTVKLPETIRQSLIARRGDAALTQWVFPDRHGKHRDPKQLSRLVSKRLERLGLGEFTLHDLRHAHATYLLQQRLPLKAVSERLGHSDVRITLDVYTHVMPGDDDSLASAIDGVL